MKYSSFAITVRPRNGVSEGGKLEESLVSWLSKQPYAFAVMEKDGEERHFHAQVWYDNPREKGTITKVINRICVRDVPDWDGLQRRYAIFVKIAYSDWWESYLADNDEKQPPNVIFEKIPPNPEHYYPSEEEQAKTLAKSNAVDKKYFALEEHYHQWNTNKEPADIWQIARFLSWAAFDSRIIKVPKNERDAKSLCSMLLQYVKKSGVSVFLTVDDFQNYYKSE